MTEASTHVLFEQAEIDHLLESLWHAPGSSCRGEYYCQICRRVMLRAGWNTEPSSASRDLQFGHKQTIRH